MPKIMGIIEKETKGKSYHNYKYSYGSIGLPSIADVTAEENILRVEINYVIAKVICNTENIYIPL